MDPRHRRSAAVASGAVIVALGCVAWSLAATSMTAVQAAEARALGPGHTAEMPGEDELALVAHDLRLAALLVVVCGLALVALALPGRTAVASWLGGVGAVVLANATLGRAVDDGSALLAAGGLLVMTGVGSGAACVVAARQDRGPSGAGPGTDGRWALVVASALAAGTLPVLALRGVWSERYVAWVPAGLATATVVTAVTLVASLLATSVLLARGPGGVVLGVVLPAGAAAVLLQPTGPSVQLREAAWASGVALVLAAAPLMLDATRGRWRAAAVLLVSGVLLAAVPQLLVPPVIVGGMLGLVVTGPAGAYVNYDGLPVLGGGVLIAVVLSVVHWSLRHDSTLPPRPAQTPAELFVNHDDTPVAR